MPRYAALSGILLLTPELRRAAFREGASAFRDVVGRELPVLVHGGPLVGQVFGEALVERLGYDALRELVGTTGIFDRESQSSPPRNSTQGASWVRRLVAVSP